MQSTALELALAALAGSLLPSAIAFIRLRRMSGAEVDELRSRVSSQRADAVDKLSETVVRLADRIKELEDRSEEQVVAIGELGTKLDRANRLIKTLLRGVAVLMNQLADLGATPDFVIPVYDDLEDLFALWSRRDEEEKK